MLHQLFLVPFKSEGSYLDDFCAVDSDPATSEIPMRFQMLKQTYSAPFDTLKENDWGLPLPVASAAISWREWSRA